MKLNVQLLPGIYTIGINRPWYASQSMVRSEIEKLTGLTNIVFRDRKTSPALPVNPRLDPYYTDDWDEWIEASYAGLPKTLSNTDKIWAWMVLRPAGIGQALPLPTPLPTKVTDPTDNKKPVSSAFIAAAIIVDLMIARALYKAATKKRGKQP